MRKFKLKKWVAAGVMCTLPYAGVVDAAGLGRLNVLSRLGQPFNAEIDLVNVTREELATLRANLAAPSAYQAANLQFNNALNSLRMSIERRNNGTPYIRATSSRPVAEPFLDLLIELSWQGGKVVREYSALLDPPGMEPPAAATTVEPPVASAPPAATPVPAAQPSVPAPAPAPKVAAVPAPAVARPAPEAAARPTPTAGAGQYTVRQGDTLSGIARQVGQEGVSLEQALLGLYRANPDAFFGSNMNNLRAGKILNVPEREQLAAIGQGEAQQEVRAHASNWNAYRRRAADMAPAVADAAPAAKGRITTRVDDKAAPAAPKDVVVLSKGDTGSGGAGKGVAGAKGGADRVRALEEDLAAREKALAESRERIAQLEKTLKDMQKLAELKNPQGAAAQQAAQQAAKGADTKPVEKPAAKAEVKVESPKVEPPKAEPAKVEPPKGEAPKVEEKSPDVATAPKPPAVPPKKKIIAPPPPPPEPSLMDTVMDNILPIGGGAAALLAGIGGIWAMRRRKQGADEDERTPIAPSFKAEPYQAPPDADKTIPGIPVAEVAAAPVTTPEVSVANVTDIVDPIDEAQVYIDHGRDVQAEEILREAMSKEPQREDVQLKLLEILAGRGDKPGFNALATDFHKLTSGVGENWKRATVLGYALDPTNPLYPSTGEVVDLAAHRDAAANVDLDLDSTPARTDAMSNTATILLDQPDSGVDMEKTMVLTRDDIKPAAAAPAAPAETLLPDFNIELPAASDSTDAAASTSTNGNMLEFNIDLPAEPATEPAVAVPSAAETVAQEAQGDSGLDFKVDFSDINLNLDDKPVTPVAAPAAAGVKDAHWEDVQQKFDLARAYQEMGDKEGALEILHEVEREGDDGQKAEAQKMIQSLK